MSLNWPSGRESIPRSGKSREWARRARNGGLGGGCQTAPTVPTQKLILHQALIDFAGLQTASSVDAVNVSMAIPQDWEALPVKKTGLYTHQQWRSPSRANAVGIAYLRLPIPL